MPTLYLICGIPASGKSTFAKKIAAAEDAVILSSGAIRQELFQGEAYNKKQNKAIFTTLKIRLKEAFIARRNIVIDSINKSPDEREKYAVRAKKNGYRTVCFFCQKHYSQAIKVNQTRDESERFSEIVIKSIYHNFVIPEESEGWDEFYVVGEGGHSVQIKWKKPYENKRRGKQKQNSRKTAL